MRPRLTALMKKREGRIEVRAPSVGLWREAPPLGSLLLPGMKLGAIEVLGTLFDLIAPEGAAGIVTEVEAARARNPVAHGDVLLVLDREHAGQLATAETERSDEAPSGMVFVSPMSGRFYRRAGPDKPPFVQDGDEIGQGQTICLLEVMKTFNRITYGGGGHPERARVVRVVPADGDDLALGDPILELQPI
jgi:acetyl-CoA carboxylase biotin carboxyl carrier protein